MLRSILKLQLNKVLIRNFSSTTVKSSLSLSLRGNSNGYIQKLETLGGGKAHVIQNDLFEELGGTDLHPDPIHHLFSSVSGCQNITAKKVSEDLGIKIGKADIQTDSSLSLVLKDPKKYPGFKIDTLKVVYEVETNATDEQFDQLRELTEELCPIAQVFINSKGLQFDSIWVKKPLLE
ncbi:hypothetical protein HYPBUDRAFT_165084 [Hyphopichia burtonii NRRL Y-1933]|uniref:OsmC-like protein n=1 Tax=Hyphopichia burtonii NRRL Y-1933 TaxID=984485 RepID=A0A1E4RTG5_9ASCO|nr:hypothetical protein HYPBUDRAFT_165084 [Hyphopichia burtonii NRRL Y-1933]ODV70569.1 hypothetical protein HYPBUDRAFT_165084 [Hyphopichia burtonii NRRL Y-1933]